jgi:hypothetical protein
MKELSEFEGIVKDCLWHMFKYHPELNRDTDELLDQFARMVSLNLDHEDLEVVKKARSDETVAR